MNQTLEPRIHKGLVINPVDPRESAYWWTGEYQTDPRYLAHLEKQAACQQPRTKPLPAA